MEMDATPRRMTEAPSRRGRGIKKVFFFLVLCALLVAGIWYWLSLPATGSSEATARQTESAVERVSKVMVLPQDEQPAIGTIIDPYKFQGGVFFDVVQMGDLVLMYPERGMLIVYSAAHKKIVGVAPFVMNTPPGISVTE